MAIRNTKQVWFPGFQVKVGFLTLTVIERVATPGNYLPDQYALKSDSGKFYRFIPHNGLVRCESLYEAMQPA